MKPERNEALILIGAAVITACGMYLTNMMSPPKERTPPKLEYIYTTTAATRPAPEEATRPAPEEATIPEPNSQSVEPVPEAEYLVEQIVKHYPHVTPKTADRIVELSFEYEERDFPRAAEIIAVIAIESSFVPTAESPLAKDPAKGLMQIRHNIWSERIGEDDMTLLRNQIKHGAGILKEYYDSTGDKISAVTAYNVGITNFMRGVRAPGYVSKYRAACNKFKIPTNLLAHGS